MTAAERTMNKYQAELNKLNTQLEKAQATYEKKLEAARKLGVEMWSRDEFHAWLETVPTTENGFIINKEDVKKNSAWFDLSCAIDRVVETKEQIKKKVIKMRQVAKEVKIQNQKLTEDEAERQRSKMINEWAQDGITVEHIASTYITGKTPNNKHFCIESNNGFTERSLHCFTLRVDGNVIFTSGEFYRAYHEIKNR